MFNPFLIIKRLVHYFNDFPIPSTIIILLLIERFFYPIIFYFEFRETLRWIVIAVCVVWIKEVSERRYKQQH